MAIPPTRALLVADAEKERDNLSALIAGMSREQLLWAGAYGWSAKDYVAHLAEWERMLFGWYDAACAARIRMCPPRATPGPRSRS